MNKKDRQPPDAERTSQARRSEAWVREVHKLPDARRDVVAIARCRIANGFYEDPECFDIATDRLLDDLD